MRTFTPDEANALLAELRPLVERLVEHKRRLDVAEDGTVKDAKLILGGIAPAPVEVKEAQDALLGAERFERQSGPGRPQRRERLKRIMEAGVGRLHFRA